MGRIKKVATERHTATTTPYVSNFVEVATSVPLHNLPANLDAFPQQWPFTRGDLYHWIPLLDRFDHILELFNKQYALCDGPQQVPFECIVLQKGDAEEGMPYPSDGATREELKNYGYSSEGDRELVESIIHFTRILLEHCGNRSLYSSSGHLDDLLNSTSLSLVRLVLRLSLRLAIRYQVARLKNHNYHPHAVNALLANHYNIKFDRLQKIAAPFPKAAPPSAGPTGSVPTVGKGKEKAAPIAIYNPSDLVSIVKEPQSTAAKGDVASVHLTYYESAPSRPGSAHQPNEAAQPVSPTPVRRTSALGPSRDRPSVGERSATTGDLSLTPVKSREADPAPSSAPKTFQLSSSKVTETPAWELVKEAVSKVPTDSTYEVLNRIRIAKAFANPESSSQQLLEIRLLAIANLAYALGESKFQEKIGLPDSEEPKRFHLAQQLCDLLQPPSNDQIPLSLELEIAVLLTIESLCKSRHKSPEISDALQITYNHGVLYYELRKVMATLSEPQHEDKKLEILETEWRETTFELTNTLLQTSAQARHGERMVSAGILGILVEALSLRTNRAERFNEKILQFLDSFVHGVQSAFQTLASVKGMDILADLASYEVTSSMDNAKKGDGLPPEFKSKLVDYNIPFYQQATLRALFKFMDHMFEHNAGTHDRLLRNLIDTPQVLGALRVIIENAPTFGSNVWSGAVRIMSSFIHNEPTSFQVVGEAGLVKSLLQTIVPWEIKDADDAEVKIEDTPVAFEYKDGELQYPTPAGILPNGDTMCDIPAAFGAICLNESGMKLFQSSKALSKFMDIFVSPAHVRALEEDGNHAASIGQAFDELSRHHPQLKEQIMSTVVTMVRRVVEVCRYLAEQKANGAKLWERNPSGIEISGGPEALAGPFHSPRSDDATNGPTIADEDEKDRVNGVPFVGVCFKFLEGFFHNTSMCSLFCEQAGAVYLLDLATSACNPYDMVAFPAFSKIAQVIKSMCDAKPHLVLPSLIRQTQIAIAGLKPIVENNNAEGAFATFTDLSKPQISSLPAGANGTTVTKSLAVVHMLTHVLGRTLASSPHFSSRHNPQANQLFMTLNFTDIYIDLVDNLSHLHAACVWENLMLQKSLPEKWKQQTEPKPFMMRRVDQNGFVEMAAELRSDNQTTGENVNGSANSSTADSREEMFAVKNAKTIRYLLSQTPMGIEAFFHSLGQALVPKRSPDSTGRRHAAVVADRIAHALVQEFTWKKFEGADDLTESKVVSQAVVLCTRTLLKSSHTMETWGAKEALSLVLNKFYLAGGFDKLNKCLDRFTGILLKKPEEAGEALHQCARETLNNILTFYSYVVRSKTINDAAQSNSLATEDYRSADYFIPGQFVVEIRNAVLPAVNKLWHSFALENIGDSHVKVVIEILRNILRAEGEKDAQTRSNGYTRRVLTGKPDFSFKHSERLRTVQSSGYDEPLAREALYRCNYSEANALDYCHLRKICNAAPSFPVPSDDTPKESAIAPPQASDGVEPSSDGQALQRQQSIEMTDVSPEELEAVRAALDSDDSSDDVDMIDEITGQPILVRRPDGLQAQSSATTGAGRTGRLRDLLAARADTFVGRSSIGLQPKDSGEKFVTVEDLDDKRGDLRDDLLERCLEILSVQPTITFELAELIQAAVPKSGEAVGPRAEIGSTLVSSLLSLQAEDPGPESGAKISAYAHLVALILQDRDFFDSTLDELKEYFDSLVDWIKLEKDQKAEDAPWIEMILLIIERVLAEDEQPTEIEWIPPPADDPLKALPKPVAQKPVVSAELRSSLLDAVISVLPKIKQSSSLALSVCRVLVILTRTPDLAKRLSDKNNMGLLFMMVRQLADSVSDKIQSCLMIILRHMIEDRPILSQIMRIEIKGVFENHRTSRAIDTTAYTRNLHHLVLRNPELFVEVTGEMVEITRYDGHPRRPQSLALKKERPAPEQVDSEKTETEETVQKSVENGPTEAAKTTEVKPPVVEITDGVIQFLLRELSNYKDVEEKPAVPAKDSPQSNGANGTSGDVDMADATTSNAATSSTEANRNDKSVTFKPEEHTVHAYRCFLMKCLAELLASYNRTKVEFINFSRKPEAQTATPSKPRSGTLNYLLNVLIPAGTLEHRDDIVHRKKLSVSYWATTVLVSLCTKTQERHSPRSMVRDQTEEDNDLTFVRRFVLEQALRAFRDATMSSEPLDMRYSRLLGLAALFNRMLNNKSERATVPTTETSTRDIGKLMYEKNFVSALTSAVAELDLNFPNAKRAVKYILGPLKLLTELGVTLSQFSDMSSNAAGTTDEDEISSATSVSDDDADEREQTPDLYRNSTLGMFDSSGARDDDTDSDSEDDEDEDMYGDDYDEDDEMDYEEGPPPDHDDVVSDEDEDVDGMGDIEGVPGDVEIEMEMVMDGDEVETASESSSDDSDEEEDDDEDDDVDVDFADHMAMEEITHDDNGSMGDPDHGHEWEEDDEGALFDAMAADVHGDGDGAALEQLAQVIRAGESSDPGEDGVVHIDMAGGDEEYFEDELPPEDEDDEDNEVDYENDVVYEPELEGAEDDDDDDGEEMRWDLGVPPPPGAIRGHHHHHHHHRHGLTEMFGMIGEVERFRGPIRAHRPTSNVRGEEDGTNPLLQREGNTGGSNRDRIIDADLAIQGRLARRAGLPRHGDSFIQDLVATMGPPGGGTINVNIGEPRLTFGGGRMPPMFAVQGVPGTNGGHALLDIDPNRTWRDQIGLPRWPELLPPHRAHDSRGPPTPVDQQLLDHRPIPTINRWQEEARMLFGGKHLDKATRIMNALFRVLIPPAMEAKKQRDKAEADRKAAEDKAKEEEKQKAEAEKAEREAREKKEREERLAKEAEEAAARAAAEQEASARERPGDNTGEETTTMEGVEQSQQAEATEAEQQAAQSEPAPSERVTTTIRGRELDITSLGIDLEYLQELPEELREEVIMGQFASQRTQAVEAGEQPSEISREFLEALPPEIQRELLRQEAADRRRRDDDARRRAAQEGNAPAAQPEEMNNADFMAMLEPNLRQAILLDADENTLATLPEDVQAEARTLLGERRAVPRPDQIGRIGRFVDGETRLMGRHADRAEQVMREAGRQRRPVMQMLDKAGIATLLRLMFVSLHHKAKTNLHSILSDVCKNTQNRAEVISILLSILQDGTADVGAVERSFAQLSLRAKQMATPKVPTPLKRTTTGTIITPGAELSPLNIVQQCLGTLNALTMDNPRVPTFFLTEHETIASQKTKMAKKGKGRENRASRFPLNSLLTLLDRKLITENTGVMETLASLLSRVTHPLIVMLRKKKEAEAEATKAKADAEKPADDQEERPGTAGSDVQMAASTSAEAQTTEVPNAGSSADATDAGTADAKEPATEDAQESKEAEKKKAREMTPPDVPEENIRLVVNIITARECPGKTFTDTLDVIKNLSSVPGAKEVFGKELVQQAQDLSQAVLLDLEELAKQINSAQNGTDLQGMALANFSTAASKQHKLLRALVSLDHLFDPKYTPALPAGTENSTESSLKDDILAGLYESSTFDKLWGNLSQCLTAIRKRGNMINVAAILLPMIEALMVVCRNSALKDSVPDPISPIVSTPPAENRLDSLFFKFTEEHRKILNELIRNTPKLMNGNLAVLAKNSKVLEFDNKRSYFTRKIHTRPQESRISHPSLQLNVRRDQVFLDSFKSLYYKTGNEIKYGKLNIRFHGEEGIDAGGVSREWFAAMARQMFNPDYALFNPVASDRTTFHPNPLSDINHEHLMFFKFIGRIIGKALYEGRVLDCHFSRAVYRRILGKSVSLKDMESLDLDYYKSLVWILENDITDITFETFSVDIDHFGLVETVDLIPGGRDIPVTEANKQEYVRLVVEHRLIKSVQSQLENFLEGFHDIIPAELVSIFNEQELELLISGLPEIDIDDWKNNTDYHNYQATSPQIQWFWRAVRSFDKEEKAKLLQFVTGTSKVPLNGFKELEGMNGFAKFNIHRDYSSKEKLPSSHTCFNQLDLPEYDSYEHLRQQMYTAITAGSEYFGFA